MIARVIVSCFVCYRRAASIHFFFFFQAEDGIRYPRVTGVQTCALPIYPNLGVQAHRTEEPRGRRRRTAASGRSEERRVGKECRSRWTPYHEKKKKLTRRMGNDELKIIKRYNGWLMQKTSDLCAYVPTIDKLIFFFASRRRHTSSTRDWSSDVCSSDLLVTGDPVAGHKPGDLRGLVRDE